MSRLTLDWANEGYQVNIYAIGDLANRLAIDAFEAALKDLCPNINPHDCQARHRFRIEHSQIIHPDDQRRMTDLGIIPSIQPTHATSDMSYAKSRLGVNRTTTEAYRMRSLLLLRPVLGSDFPVEPASIFEGMYAAVARRSPRTGLDPSGGKRRSPCMTHYGASLLTPLTVLFWKTKHGCRKLAESNSKRNVGWG